MMADKMNEDAEKLKGFLYRIIDEHKVACRKHPDFVSSIIDPSSRVSWAESEARIKLRNSRGPQCADNILMEEVAEAFAAYQQGDKEHALQELAQCGAVILRIMEKIDINAKT
jgi:hypothetical protein